MARNLSAVVTCRPSSMYIAELPTLVGAAMMRLEVLRIFCPEMGPMIPESALAPLSRNAPYERSHYTSLIYSR
jgi:hypothetical protein